MKKIFSLILFSLLSTLGLPQDEVFGFGASGGVGPSQQNSFATTDLDGLKWELGTPTNRIEISFDNNAGPWLKEFQGLGGEAIMADDESGNLPTIFTVTERLVVGPNSSPWTDWHEKITTPGWIWRIISISVQYPDFSTDQLGGPGNIVVQDDGTSELWIFFDPSKPLIPGTTIVVNKQLFFEGSITGQTETFSGFVNVKQWPSNGINEIPEMCPEGQVGTPPDCREPFVGGEFLGINTAMILLAGSQMTSSWLAPLLVASVGLILVVLRKI